MSILSSGMMACQLLNIGFTSADSVGAGGNPSEAGKFRGEGMAWREISCKVRFSIPSAEAFGVLGYFEKFVMTPMVMRYNTEVRGIIVAYSGSELLSHAAVVDGISPFLRVNAKVNLLVFAPEKGVLLTGVVSFVGEEFIGLKVFKSFYAVIYRRNAPSGFKYRASLDNKATGDGNWIRESERMGEDAKFLPSCSVIETGTQLTFVNIGLMHTKSGISQIKGSLRSMECLVLGKIEIDEEQEPLTGWPQQRKSRKFQGKPQPPENKPDDLLRSGTDMLGFGDPLAELSQITPLVGSTPIADKLDKQVKEASAADPQASGAVNTSKKAQPKPDSVGVNPAGEADPFSGSHGPGHGLEAVATDKATGTSMEKEEEDRAVTPTKKQEERRDKKAAKKSKEKKNKLFEGKVDKKSKVKKKKESKKKDVT